MQLQHPNVIDYYTTLLVGSELWQVLMYIDGGTVKHLLSDQFPTGLQVMTQEGEAVVSYILENVLDPSAVVGRDYRMTTVLLEDGRVLSGMLKDETDSALTI